MRAVALVLLTISAAHAQLQITADDGRVRIHNPGKAAVVGLRVGEAVVDRVGPGETVTVHKFKIYNRIDPADTCDNRLACGSSWTALPKPAWPMPRPTRRVTPWGV